MSRINPLQDLPPKLIYQAEQVRLLAMDVDGVLTDGRLYFSATGDELKAFNILDGHGIKMLHNAGIQTALITGRRSPLTEKRARDLGIHHVFQGREDKLNALTELAETLGISLNEVGYIGDDLPDLGAIQSAGLGLTVPNAYWVIREAADWCTRTPGGGGAIREVSDLILAAQDHLTGLLQSYQAEVD